MLKNQIINNDMVNIFNSNNDYNYKFNGVIIPSIIDTYDRS